MFVPDWLARRESLSPDRVALVDMLRGGRTITYRAWNRAANRTAHFLRGPLGIGKGERVAVLAKNCTEYLDLLFACAKTGAILASLNWRLTPAELQGILADVSPSVLVYGPGFEATVRALAGSDAARGIRHFVAVGEAAMDGHVAFSDRESFTDASPPAVPLTEDDPWVLCSTGGSTGLPKAAVLTHGNILWNAINTIVSWGLRPDDTSILDAPLFHTGGLNVFTAPLVHIGGTSIVCSGFDPGLFYDLLESARPTVYFGVPTMFLALSDHPRFAAADFSGLRIVISGGAPCPAPIFERYWARGIDFKTGYGLTEAGPNTFWLPPADVRRKPGSVGAPLFHIDVRIVDPEGRDVAADEVGELWVRGPHVCKGYWNRPEETAAAIVDGWLRTGDLARRDAEGHHYIVGRKKDVIISGGENIYPAEVESVLAAHPALAEVALVGEPDTKWGEVGLAIVVPRPGLAPTEDEILAFCRDRLARYKVPRRVVFTTELARTGAGKVDKRLLRERHGQRPAG
ncbi:MAG: long-chain fatty acid--CoA ligase [Minicystis sp.]